MLDAPSSSSTSLVSPPLSKEGGGGDPGGPIPHYSRPPLNMVHYNRGGGCWLLKRRKNGEGGGEWEKISIRERKLPPT